ncbi:putative protein of unknown function [Methylorubrum extorquens DM4]|jgi:hypothetical protein|uniref:Uncharacterized protein n=1 Tax=Methylorubrum extorquens (strain DSM 6343 / CIP 106787 / DM4) TaxID=661410 RepID=A0A2P9HAQ2_METED|nr:putative protein of unknown function [Methylorubrum extorquens DM4]
MSAPGHTLEDDGAGNFIVKVGWDEAGTIAEDHEYPGLLACGTRTACSWSGQIRRKRQRPSWRHGSFRKSRISLDEATAREKTLVV